MGWNRTPQDIIYILTIKTIFLIQGGTQLGTAAYIEVVPLTDYHNYMTDIRDCKIHPVQSVNVMYYSMINLLYFQMTERLDTHISLVFFVSDVNQKG